MTARPDLVLRRPLPTGTSPDAKQAPCPIRAGRFTVESGAGDGNRTHVISLGSWSSTIELHPHARLHNDYFSRNTTFCQHLKRQLLSVWAVLCEFLHLWRAAGAPASRMPRMSSPAAYRPRTISRMLRANAHCRRLPAVCAISSRRDGRLRSSPASIWQFRQLPFSSSSFSSLRFTR
jgi:hypothetical protein